jgi:hypothetical protein
MFTIKSILKKEQNGIIKVMEFVLTKSGIQEQQHSIMDHLSKTNGRKISELTAENGIKELVILNR